MRSELAFLGDFKMKEIPSAAAAASSFRWFFAILFGGKPVVGRGGRRRSRGAGRPATAGANS